MDSNGKMQIRNKHTLASPCNSLNICVLTTSLSGTHLCEEVAYNRERAFEIDTISQKHSNSNPENSESKNTYSHIFVQSPRGCTANVVRHVDFTRQGIDRMGSGEVRDDEAFACLRWRFGNIEPDFFPHGEYLSLKTTEWQTNKNNLIFSSSKFVLEITTDFTHTRRRRVSPGILRS